MNLCSHDTVCAYGSFLTTSFEDYEIDIQFQGFETSIRLENWM